MPDFRELDPSTTFQAQLSATTGPIVLANVLSATNGEVDQLIQIWAADAAFMRSQPGFVSAQLHRGVAGSTALLNLAVWESAVARQWHGTTLRCVPPV